MQAYLFIGGTHDSLNIPVADGQDEARPHVCAMGSELYIRSTLAVDDVSITIYRYESLTPEQVLNQLVGHYKRSPVRWPPRRTTFSGRLSTG